MAGAFTAVFGSFAGSAPAIPADVYLSLAGQTTGATLTPTIVTNGTQGTGMGTPTLTPSTPVGFTVDNSANRIHSAFVVSGTTYNAGYTGNKRFSLTNIVGNTYCTYPLPGGKTNISAGFFLTNNYSRNLFALFDILGFTTGITGRNAIVQAHSSNSATPIGLRIESNYDGSTGQTTEYPMTDGATYWVSFNTRLDTGVSTLQIFETSGWTLVSSQSITDGLLAETFSFVRFGNAEFAAGTGTAFFENIFLDWTNHAQPLGP